jgi:hypothetical protein
MIRALIEKLCTWWVNRDMPRAFRPHVWAIGWIDRGATYETVEQCKRCGEKRNSISVTQDYERCEGKGEWLN